MGWTKQQQRTIDERDRNLLVSAAAGSGKTAVLVERIKKMVTEEGVPIDRMLVVTFTNAAASEMREKIRRALKEKSREVPELKDQLELMPRASISTFHAFALDVIHHFFYLIDMEPDFTICDDAQSTVLKEEALDDLLESRFADDDRDFYDFLDWYGSERSNDSVRDMIKSVHNSLMALPEPFETLDAKIRELEMSPGDYMKTDAMVLMLEDVADTFKTAFDNAKAAYDLLLDNGLENLAEKFKPDMDMCAGLSELATKGDLAGLSAGLSNVSWTTLRAGKDEKEEYALIKDQVSALRDKAKDSFKTMKESYFSDTIENQLADINKVSGQARTLQKLVMDFDRIFREKKLEKKLVDFNDIEHDCLDILKQPGTSEFYKEKFLYVFIDEYQDTSVLQEAIIDRIKGEDNLFMVGDIKQSIYKFRLAEPEIFKNKYRDFAACEDGKSAKIDLNRNFRSKPVILDNINKMFQPIMEGYDADASLYPGIGYDGEFSFAPEAKVIDISSVDDADEAIRDLKKSEIEALEVCRLIKENLGKEYYDSKAGQTKKLRYRDMVILMRAMTKSGIFYDIMSSQGIPLYIDNNKGYFDTMEINVCLNLLSIIDNKYQDVAFISVLRSEIFGFTTDQLADIRLARQSGSYVEAFMAYAGADDDGSSSQGAEGGHEAGERKGDDELRRKCSRVLSDLGRWKKLSLAMPLPEFLWKILLDTGYYMIMGAMPDGTQRQANLRYLIDRTETFSASGQSSLYSFIRYIDTVKEKDVDMGQVKLLGENDDVVRLMTIHKSKGLEFPMVIVSGLGSKLSYAQDAGKSKVLFHKDVGLGMYLEDPAAHTENRTLPYNIIVSKIKKEELEEHIRVLYVAFTRAREKLFLTGTVSNGEKFQQAKENSITSTSTYLNLLEVMPETEIIDCASLVAPEKEVAGRARGGSRILMTVEPDPETFAQVSRRLEYEYPYAAARKLRGKYSVSALNRENADTAPPLDTAVMPGSDAAPAPGAAPASTEAPAPVADAGASPPTLEKPKFLQGERQMTAAERGTVYHGIMERLDFSRAGKEGRPYLEAAVSDFVAKGIFLPTEVSAIDLGRIEEFFAGDVGKRCIKAYESGKLYRELPFDVKMSMEGEDVIVQGIVDCCFEEDGAIVLLDYKTNWIDRSKAVEDEEARIRELYRRQIEIYSEALEKGLGKPVRESYLYLFAAGRSIEVKGK